MKKNYKQLFVEKNKKENSIILVDKNNAEWLIPFDKKNKDYRDYLKWLEKGNKPEKYKESPQEKKEKKEKEDHKKLNTKIKALKKKVKDKGRTDDDLDEILLYLLRNI